jgi:hypothetical protein
MKLRTFALGLFTVLAGCGGSQSTGAQPGAAVADRATPVGDAAPAGDLIAAGGETVALAERWAGADQTVVVFYRGFF